MASSNSSIMVGKKLPPIVIKDKGQMVIDHEMANGIMVHKRGTKIKHKTFDSDDLAGRINTIYHLAARSGSDDINQPFIDALIAAKVPEHQPDSPYKTTTILNTHDSLWGTAAIGIGRLEDSQKKTAYANYVVDSKGLALKKWGLNTKSSAVILLDKDNTVIYFKDGKMSRDDISEAVAVIEKHLAG